MINIDHPYMSEKIFVHRDRLDLLKEGKLVPPVTVDIDLTDSCDHKCPWCEYARFRMEHPKHLARDVALRLLTDLSNTPVRGLIFAGGGEPTVYPFFKDVAKRLSDGKLRAALFTHGAHIEKYAEEIASAFIYVRISLDAGSSLTHAEYHTGGDSGAFRRIFENLELLHQLNSKLRLGISVILTDKNYLELDNLNAILANSPVNFLLLKYSRFARDNSWVTVEKLNIIKDQVKKIIEKMPVYYRDPVLEPYKVFPVKVCRTTYLKTLVAPDGHIYVCNQRRGESKMAFGNLYERGFWEIWESVYHKVVYSQIDTSECIPCRHIPYNQLFDDVRQAEVPEVNVSDDVGELTSFL